MGWLTRSEEQAPCTVEISHRFESLHAHLRLDNGAVIYPGDEVEVHGGEIMAPFGEIVVESRMVGGEIGGSIYGTMHLTISGSKSRVKIDNLLEGLSTTSSKCRFV